MARWTAKCWLGSASGYQDIEVSANTINGAKEQLQNIYGAEQIINLREIRNSGGGGGGGIELGRGGWTIIGVLLGFGAIVAYWYIILPIAILVGLGWWFLSKE
jgi:hypothetical protein